MDKLLLLTGASGFVGANLTPYLEDRGYIVRGFSRAPKNTVLQSYDTLTVSALNTSLACIHLAGKAHDLSNNVVYEDYKKANLEKTIRIFDMFLESSCQKFIYVSSVKAVRDTTDEPLHEEMIPNPKTFYGISKYEAEKYILSRSIPEDKKVFILRPCMIHGPGNKGNLNLLYQFIKKGIPFPLGAYNNKRSFLSIENFNFITEKICSNDIPEGSYNLADFEPMSTNELVSLIAKTLGRKPKILSVPKFLIQFAASLGSLFKLPFSTSRLHKLTENYTVNTEKIRSVLKTELPISTREGLRRTIQSFEK